MKHASWYKQIADEAKRKELEKADALAREIIEANDEEIAKLAAKGRYRAEFVVHPQYVGLSVAQLYKENGYVAGYDGSVVTVIWGN